MKDPTYHIFTKSGDKNVKTKLNRTLDDDLELTKDHESSYFSGLSIPYELSTISENTENK